MKQSPLKRKMKLSHHLYQSIAYLQTLLWLLLLFPFALIYNDILSNYMLLLWAGVISIALLTTSLISYGRNKPPFQITLVDVLLLSYAGYLLLNVFCFHTHTVPDSFWIRYLVVFSVYTAVRLMTEKQRRAGLMIVLIMGLLEAVFIVLQHYGILLSRHLLFNYTGSFTNPGLAGGFLAYSICLLIYFLSEVPHSIKRWLIAVIGLSLLIYALILTGSRAGWLAAIGGSSFLLWHGENKRIMLIKQKLGKSLILKIGLITCVFAGLLFIYQLKKGSADGRLFIWMNCIEMAKDKPIAGHGIDQFRGKYPDYQTNFFIENPDSDYGIVAGAPTSPFNEFLAVLTMQGVMGVGFVITILLALFLYKPTAVSDQKKKTFLLAFCIFSFFSYPMQSPRLLVLLPLFMAILPAKKVRLLTYRKANVVVLSCIMVFALYYEARVGNKLQNLASSFKAHQQVSPEEYKYIKCDFALLEKYYTSSADSLSGENKLALMEDYIEMYPSPKGLCTVGRKYKELNNLIKAKELFVKASYMNPSLITPNYELFLLYQEMGDTENLKITGEKILSQKLKKESTVSIKMKVHVREVLASNK